MSALNLRDVHDGIFQVCSALWVVIEQQRAVSEKVKEEPIIGVGEVATAVKKLLNDCKEVVELQISKEQGGEAGGTDH